MSFLHTHSSECIKSELDFFSLPPTQTSIESSQRIYYKPVTSLMDDSPIEFVIPGHGELYADGIQIPSRSLQPNFSKDEPLYVEAYHTIFSGTGIHFLNEGNSISRDDYANGYTLFAFDLTPDLSANCAGHWNLVKHGSLRLEVRFEKALSVTINCIVYAEFDNVLEIDSSRQVIVDFSG
ncbi:Uncharacterized protein F54H12.2 [Trachymyrmex cornetzi]|uniref:Uncharacterized protein F54H12.2 n=1 Tax=Trachymyrmex cornetzi TaxID=471704 RepID=A0A151J465_9HYME|nr:Uncharacterized protein F54H12.2 [Trachymyrmex cornetzi]